MIRRDECVEFQIVVDIFLLSKDRETKLETNQIENMYSRYMSMAIIQQHDNQVNSWNSLANLIRISSLFFFRTSKNLMLAQQQKSKGWRSHHYTSRERLLLFFPGIVPSNGEPCIYNVWGIGRYLPPRGRRSLIIGVG